MTMEYIVYRGALKMLLNWRWTLDWMLNDLGLNVGCRPVGKWKRSASMKKKFFEGSAERVKIPDLVRSPSGTYDRSEPPPSDLTYLGQFYSTPQWSDTSGDKEREKGLVTLTVGCSTTKRILRVNHVPEYVQNGLIWIGSHTGINNPNLISLTDINTPFLHHPEGINCSAYLQNKHSYHHTKHGQNRTWFYRGCSGLSARLSPGRCSRSCGTSHVGCCGRCRSLRLFNGELLTS